MVRDDWRVPTRCGVGHSSLRKAERGLSQAAVLMQAKAPWNSPRRLRISDTLRSGTLRAPAAKGRGIYPAGTRGVRTGAGNIQTPLGEPGLLRTEVRAPALLGRGPLLLTSSAVENFWKK